jgi:hypothetical protein
MRTSFLTLWILSALPPPADLGDSAVYLPPGRAAIRAPSTARGWLGPQLGTDALLEARYRSRQRG